MIRLVNRYGAEKILPRTISIPQIPLDINVPSQSLYGLPGAVKTGQSTLGPRQFTIQGTIINRNKADTRQELDLLLPFLMEPPIEVYRHHEDTRHIRAYPLGGPQEWLTGDAELRLRVPMIALDPHWYGPQATVEVATAQVVEVDGNAPVAPYMRTTSSAGGLTVTSATTGDKLIVTGSGVIEVDNTEFTCLINGNNRLDAVNAEWLLTGFSLLPGANAITTSAPIEMIFRPRWY